MSRVLVTGATGFTGSHLAKHLVEDGASVVAFVRPSSDREALERAGIECHEVDITDAEAVRANFDSVDTVYHLAAAFRSEHADRSEFHRVNVQATRNLLEAASRGGVERFVHCSTVGVQGEIDHPPADEAYRTQPGDHYQETKLQGELLAREYGENGLPVGIVRPVGIYGAGDRRFLKLFRAIASGTFVMIGSGDTLYHMTHVTDTVRGMVLVGTRPEAVGRTFTIAGASYTTLDELVRLIAKVLEVSPPSLSVPYAPVHAASVVCEKSFRFFGLEPPLYPRRVEFFSKDRAFDISRAREELGYRPRVSLEEGLRRTAAWYRSQGLL